MGQPDPGTVDGGRTAESAVVLTDPEITDARTARAFKNQIPRSGDRVAQRDPTRVCSVIFQGRSARHDDIAPGISISGAGSQLQYPGRDHGPTRQIHIPQGQLTRTHLSDLGSAYTLVAGGIVESQVGRSIHNIKSAVGIILPENSATGVRSRSQIPQRSTLDGESSGSQSTAVVNLQHTSLHPGSHRVGARARHSHRSGAGLIHAATGVTGGKTGGNQQIHILRAVRHVEGGCSVQREGTAGRDRRHFGLITARKNVDIHGLRRVLSTSQFQLSTGHIHCEGSATPEMIRKVRTSHRSAVNVESVDRDPVVPTKGVSAGILVT